MGETGSDIWGKGGSGRCVPAARALLAARGSSAAGAAVENGGEPGVDTAVTPAAAAPTAAAPTAPTPIAPTPIAKTSAAKESDRPLKDVLEALFERL